MIELQDKHTLNVNMLLWCMWCATRFEAPEEIAIRKAAAISSEWSANVTEKLREARRALKSPAPRVDRVAAESLRQDIKAAELAAEKIEQEALEAFAVEYLRPTGREGGAASRARKTIAQYAKIAGAARTPDFTVSLLENLIELSFPASESDDPAS